MLNKEFNWGDYNVCRVCATLSPAECPPEYQMAVLMTGTCPGLVQMIGSEPLSEEDENDNR